MKSDGIPTSHEHIAFKIGDSNLMDGFQLMAALTLNQY